MIEVVALRHIVFVVVAEPENVPDPVLLGEDEGFPLAVGVTEPEIVTEIDGEYVMGDAVIETEEVADTQLDDNGV